MACNSSLSIETSAALQLTLHTLLLFLKGVPVSLPCKSPNSQGSQISFSMPPRIYEQADPADNTDRVWGPAATGE